MIDPLAFFRSNMWRVFAVIAIPGIRDSALKWLLVCVDPFNYFQTSAINGV